MDSFKSIMISNGLAQDIIRKDSLAKVFHASTKHSKKILDPNMYRSRKLINSENFRETISLPEKSYPAAPQKVLPKIDNHKNDLTKAIYNRKSQVSCAIEKKIDLSTLSYLCWSMYGKNKNGTRNSPSGGALYPCELYVISLNTELEKGVYHYRPSLHVLEKVKHCIPNIEEYIMLSNGFEATSVIFVTSIIFDRTIFKYGDRGYRYALLEAGAMGQNLSLMATNLKLTATTFGGSSDTELEKVLGLDGISETVINCILVNCSDRES